MACLPAAHRFSNMVIISYGPSVRLQRRVRPTENVLGASLRMAPIVLLFHLASRRIRIFHVPYERSPGHWILAKNTAEAEVELRSLCTTVSGFRGFNTLLLIDLWNEKLA